MKTIFIFLFLIISASKVQAQNSFNFEDSTFVNGNILTTYRVKFDFNKAVLKKESTAFLDSMVVFMNNHTSLKFEIQNHTDSRAQATYSTNITQRRAETVVDYLVSKGIAKERLIAKGYFNTQLLISDEEISKLKTKSEKERAHQKNRRTVFVITEL